MSVDPAVKALATGPNFAVLSFKLRGGAIASHVMWVDATDDHVLINTEVHRAKVRAMNADPGVTVVIVDAANPYHYAEVRGRVVDTETGPAARAHIDALAKRYTGADEYPNPIRSERVIGKIAPERQRVQ